MLQEPPETTSWTSSASVHTLKLSHFCSLQAPRTRYGKRLEMNMITGGRSCQREDCTLSRLLAESRVFACDRSDAIHKGKQRLTNTHTCVCSTLPLHRVPMVATVRMVYKSIWGLTKQREISLRVRLLSVANLEVSKLQPVRGHESHTNHSTRFTLIIARKFFQAKQIPSKRLLATLPRWCTGGFCFKNWNLSTNHTAMFLYSQPVGAHN